MALPVEYWDTDYSQQQIALALENAVPKVGTNGTWEIWNIRDMAWVDTGLLVSGQPPYIGANGNWWVWSSETGAYKDTGVTAATSLANGAVTTEKLAAEAVTVDKLASDVKDYFQPPVKYRTLPLPASGWTQVSGTDNYTQPVTISGVTANTRVDLQPDETVLTQLSEDGVIGLFVVNTNGTLTAKAVGAAPTAALSVQASLTEVSACAASSGRR